MEYLKLPGNDARRLTFYLAMEEHAAHILKANDNLDELFFMWQVKA